MGLTEEQLLARAAAEAAETAIRQISFWPDQVITSLAGLSVLILILLPHR
jgi:hypothetical protein